MTTLCMDVQHHHSGWLLLPHVAADAEFASCQATEALNSLLTFFNLLVSRSKAHDDGDVAADAEFASCQATAALNSLHAQSL